MRTEPGTIDLGLYHVLDDRDHERERAGPGWGRFGWRSRRWLPPLALVAVLCGTVAAAAPVPPPLLMPLWTVPDLIPDTYSAVAVGGDSLYAATAADEGWVLTAHQLADGELRWSTPLELGYAGRPEVVPEQGVWVQVVGQTPLVTSGRSSRTTAFDPGTGQPRWSHAGQPWYATSGDQDDGKVVLVEWPAGAGGATLTMVDPVTGALAGQSVRLATDEPTFTAWWSPTGEGHLFTLRHDGLLSRHGLTSGEVVTSQTEHQAPEPMTDHNDLWVVDNLLIVADRSGDPPGLSAYDPVTLEPRWMARHGLWATACGPVVCVEVGSELDDRPVTRIDGIDPMTGAVRWSLRCAGESDGSLCGTSVSPLEPGDRLWVEQWVGSDPPSAWLADPATGEPLTGPVADGWQIADAQPFGSDLLLVRPEMEGEPDGMGSERPPTMWWARAAADLSGLETLGRTGPGWCLAAHEVEARRYLVCHHGDGSEPGDVTVWRLAR